MAAKSASDLIAEVKKEIQEISPEEVHRRLGSEPDLVVVDVREPDEVAQGQIRGAHAIPRGFLELKIENVAPRRDAPVVLYCAAGSRSALAAKALKELGYGRVYSMAGGFNAWKRAGFEVYRERQLTPEQRMRYARHLSMPEVGEAGQKKLLEAKVLCIGAGGLGSPAAFYLAAAGVGTIGIVDDDVVDESNLQRQILHNTKRLGQPKVDSARETLTALNPDVTVVGHQTRLSSANVMEIFADYDVIVDGSDNFPTRYLVNDASVFLDKPVVHGSIFRFEGQCTVFKPHDGPCYRCLYPEPPPPGLAPSCAEAGVLGVLPGLVGSMECLEALKLILGIGESLVGKLWSVDTLHNEFRILKLRRDPKCPVCGDNPTITELIDYEQFCSVAA
ncbi:MAG: molybdopterin-synthase adenylyltransferase MoeB [Deltaproteobacteria bacterium]|nr:MAG: molybdopterin-synthase adenylyltransferase MoeB [Deltaproteobacteria bacterium]